MTLNHHNLHFFEKKLSCTFRYVEPLRPVLATNAAPVSAIVSASVTPHVQRYADDERLGDPARPKLLIDVGSRITTVTPIGTS